MARGTVRDGRPATQRGKRVRIGACLAICAVSVFVAGPARAQQSVTYSFSPSSGSAGTTISFDGTGCPPDDNPDRSDGRFEVFATTGAGVNSGSLLTAGSFHSNDDGSFSGEAERAIPDAAALGEHQTQVVCGSGRSVGGIFEVTAPEAADAATETSDELSADEAEPARSIPVAAIPLARTGSSTGALVALAVALVIVGTVLATGARRTAG